LTAAEPVPVGVAGPDFTARNQYGETVRAVDLRGRRALLVFYPWAFSRICSGELSDLQGRADEIAALGVRLLAVSCDAVFSLRAYAEEAGFPFELLSDHWPHGAIARAYGVFDEQAGCAVRGSFLLDTDGTVRWSVVHGIGEARDMAAHLAALAAG
jgi:peroxiredoxin